MIPLTSSLSSDTTHIVSPHHNIFLAMASSAHDGPYEVKAQDISVDEEKNYHVGPRRSSIVASVREVSDQTHRKLKSRHIQLIGIGGTIGTALYVQIGRGLMNGGPAALFLAFTLW